MNQETTGKVDENDGKIGKIKKFLQKPLQYIPMVPDRPC